MCCEIDTLPFSTSLKDRDMRCVVGVFQKVLKAFDGLLQVVVVAGVDDSLALNRIALGELFPQFIDSIVPNDFGDILRFC